MPYYDYSRRKSKPDVSATSGGELTATTTRLENERRKTIQPVEYVKAEPPKVTPTTKVIVTQPPPPPPPIKIVQPAPPPMTTIIAHIPPARSSVGVNTDYTHKSSIGTMIDRDLLRPLHKGVNTDLRWDQLDLKQPKKKLNHFYEGFRSYYDEEADVLGVMCCICCATRWNRCDNIFKGCRNVVSCPVYCWLLFIIPFFIGICLAILFTGLHGGRVI